MRGLRATTHLSAGVLAFGLSVTATFAFAAADDEPIRIERCAVAARSVFVDPFNGIRSQVADATELRFVNGRAASATQVSISIRYAGTTYGALEVGTFATGVVTSRELAAFAGVPYGAERAACRVTAATFSDGSTWTATPAK